MSMIGPGKGVPSPRGIQDRLPPCCPSMQASLSDGFQSGQTSPKLLIGMEGEARESLPSFQEPLRSPEFAHRYSPLVLDRP